MQSIGRPQNAVRHSVILHSPASALELFTIRHDYGFYIKMCLMNLNDARRIAMALPEVTEEPHFESTSFRVKRKIFATAPPDGEHLHIFVADEDRELALVMAPDVIEKLWWGGKVTGLRVALHRAKKPLVAELLKKAWLRRAPKALAATVQGGAQRP